MNVTGSCHCGNIRYSAEVDGGRVMLCHCTDCQRLSGTAFRTVVPTVPGTFACEGVPAEYVKVADSGNRRIQAFCPNCGTHLYSTAADDASVHILRTGTIDQRDALMPSMQIWTRSAVSWLGSIPGMRSSPHEELLGRDV